MNDTVTAKTIAEIDWSRYGNETGGYGSREYVKTYLAKGELPHIHQPIEDAVTAFWEGKPGGGMIDFGACVGFMSLRMHRLGFGPVIGIEPTERDVLLFNELLVKPGVTVLNKILDVLDPASVADFSNLIKTNDIKTVMARRVISELVCRYGKRKAGVLHTAAKPWVPEGACETFADMLADSGIEFVILQGRAYSSRSTHPVPHTDAEIAALSSRFRVAYRAKDVAIMEVK